MPVAVGAWVGSLIGVRVASPWVLLPPIAVLLFLLSKAGIRSHLVTLCGAGVALLAGHLAYTSYVTDPVTEAARGHEEIQLIGRLAETPTLVRTPWGSEQTVSAVSTQAAFRGGSFIRSSVRVRLVGKAQVLEQFQRGDTVLLTGKTRDGFWATAPGAGELTARSAMLVRSPSSIQAEANRIRRNMVETTSRVGSSAAALTLGMAIGDRQLLPPEDAENMRVASLTHLTAISGTHIGIVMLFIQLVIPGGRIWRPLVSLLFLGFLLAVVGPSPSLLRAGAMALLGTAGLVGVRVTQPQVLLAAVTVTWLIADPWLSVNYGFALSVLATAGVLLSGRRWVKWVRDQVRNRASRGVSKITLWLTRLVGEAAVIAAAASLWVLPVLLLLNPAVPLWSVLANVLAMPAVTPVTLLGLAAATLGTTMPGVSMLLVQVADPFSAWIVFVARFCASLPGAQLPWPAAPFGPLLAAGLVGLMAAADARTWGTVAATAKGRVDAWLHQLRNPH